MIKSVILVSSLVLFVSFFNVANARDYEASDYISTKYVSKIYQSKYSIRTNNSPPLNSEAFYCYFEQYPKSSSETFLNISKAKYSYNEIPTRIILKKTDCFTDYRNKLVKWYKNNDRTMPHYKLDIFRKGESFEFYYARYLASCMYEKDQAYFNDKLRKTRNKEKSISKFMNKKGVFDNHFYKIGSACSDDFQVIFSEAINFRRKLLKQLLIRKALEHA